MGVARSTLRQRILVRSVESQLHEHTVHDAVMMWTRHRWFVPYVAVAAALLLGVATATGIESWFNRLVLAGCGMAVAGLATTNWWILADTSNGLALLRSSRIRQYAKQLERWLPDGVSIAMVASTVITSEWRIDKTVYTVTKRFEGSLRRLSTAG